jgi:catechol 2,3-dioxygenase-like lactoylglutathione lyase family enzyme
MSIDITQIKFVQTSPIMSVTDIAIALQFYGGILGFEKIFENGDPVGFMILKKDDARFDLSLNKKHRPTTQNVAFLKVADASALYDICVSRGVRIIKGIRDANYGLRTFVMADPDGNRIDVGQPI